MKTIQYRLGHASASLTMNLHAHALPENDAQAAQLIGNLFSETLNEQARQNRAFLVAVQPSCNQIVSRLPLCPNCVP